MGKGSRRLQHILINLDFKLTAKGKKALLLSVQVQYIVDFQH
jgi:hypothetical protein